MTYIQNILITINRAGCPSRSIRTITSSRNSGWFHSSLNNRHAIIQDNTNSGATTKTLSRGFTTKNYGTASEQDTALRQQRRLAREQYARTIFRTSSVAFTYRV